MAHIKSFGIENFRRFKEEARFEFAPITLFTGPNSSGKSSCVKAMELLSKNLQASSGKVGALNWSHMKYEVGTGSDLVNDLSKPIQFVVPVNNSFTESNMLLEFEYSVGEKFNGSLSGFCILEKPRDWEKETYREKPNRILELKLDPIRQEEFTQNVHDSELGKKQVGNFATSVQPYRFSIDISYWIQALKNTIKEEAQTEISIPELLRQISVTHGHDEESKDYRKRMANVFESFWEVKSVGRRASGKVARELKSNEAGLKEVLKDIDSHNFWDLEMLKPIFTRPFDSRELMKSFKEGLELDYMLTFDNIGTDTIHEILNEVLGGQRDVTAINLLIGLGVIDARSPDFPGLPQLTDAGKILFDQILGSIKGMLKMARSTVHHIKHSTHFAQMPRLILDRPDSSRAEKIIRDYIEYEGLRQKQGETEFVNSCLYLFGIGDSIEIVEATDLGWQLFIVRDGHKRNLADIGFGHGQLVLLLLQIVIAERQFIDAKVLHNYSWPKALVLEEPENFLHPNLQSKLADLFILAGKELNVQFIVETHSEYLIRKLQHHIAQGTIGDKDAVIYYFNPGGTDKNHPAARRIEFTEDGNLTAEFCSGFFDEADNLAIGLFDMKNTNIR